MERFTHLQSILNAFMPLIMEEKEHRQAPPFRYSKTFLLETMNNSIACLSSVNAKMRWTVVRRRESRLGSLIRRLHLISRPPRKARNDRVGIGYLRWIWDLQADIWLVPLSLVV